MPYERIDYVLTACGGGDAGTPRRERTSYSSKTEYVVTNYSATIQPNPTQQTNNSQMTQNVFPTTTNDNLERGLNVRAG